MHKSLSVVGGGQRICQRISFQGSCGPNMCDIDSYSSLSRTRQRRSHTTETQLANDTEDKGADTEFVSCDLKGCEVDHGSNPSMISSTGSRVMHRLFTLIFSQMSQSKYRRPLRPGRRLGRGTVRKSPGLRSSANPLTAVDRTSSRLHGRLLKPQRPGVLKSLARKRCTSLRALAFHSSCGLE
jgi:hypothetical protein